MYPSQKKLLASLGERLRLARLRRRISTELTCERAAISRMTLYRVERGSPDVALGTLLRLLSVLGLDADLDLIAGNDKFGRVLQDQKLPQRRTRRARSDTQAPPDLSGA
jgi:transcriptional regulator with XRE-family HTH domain